MLTWVLAAAALAAGVTGAWSPCGFSMVETLAPAGYAGRLRTTLVACVTFTLGALAGGVLTFGGLAMLGEALGAGGTGAAVVAAAIAVAAAVGEARGLRIVPQVRRQVPESWRRVLPVPLAAGLYGVLLGLGFTTFILTFAVWALAAVSVALGDPALGAVLGLAFGAGRALPVIALAPVADERPRQRRARRDGRAAGDPARPARRRRRRARALRRRDRRGAGAGGAPRRGRGRTIAAAAASGPAAGRGPVRLPAPRRPGYLRRAGGTFVLPGRDPALAAGLVGWRDARAGSCSPTRTRSRPVGDLRVARRRRLRVQRPVGRVARRHDAARRPAAQRSAPRRASSRPRARASSSAARRSPARRSSSTARAAPAPRSACSTSRSGRERRAALRAPRAAAQPLLRRPRAALRALHLHAPGAAARPARPPRDRRATAASTAPRRPRRRDAGHEPGRGRHRVGLPGRQAAAARAAPARGRRRRRCGRRRSGRARRT